MHNEDTDRKRLRKVDRKVMYCYKEIYKENLYPNCYQRYVRGSFKTVIVSVLLYASENWVVSRMSKNALAAFKGLY